MGRDPESLRCLATGHIDLHDLPTTEHCSHPYANQPVDSQAYTQTSQTQLVEEKTVTSIPVVQ